MSRLADAPTSRHWLRSLAAPFAGQDVHWKAVSTTKDKTRGLAVAFVDARAVMERLDDVLGPDGWQDAYRFLPDGTAVCTLRVKIGERWVAKVDVGGASDQEDAGDRRKAAVSDALKRAAVKLGIGRYLYAIPKVWVDYDADRKQLKTTPTLPAWALPVAQGKPEREVKPQRLTEGQHDTIRRLIKDKDVSQVALAGALVAYRAADMRFLNQSDADDLIRRLEKMGTPNGTGDAPRRAFTLLELLVVVAIVAILVALTGAAVFRVLSFTASVTTSSDIAGLKQALTLYHTKRGAYPPSRIVLYEKLAYYGNSELETYSVAALKQAFDRRIASPQGPWASAGGPGIQWNPAGSVGTKPIVLEGDQCLVFFLGTPFSTNALNPMDKTVGTEAPLYDFPSGRLVRFPHQSGADDFPAFVDGWRRPYAYFSAYGIPNLRTAGAWQEYSRFGTPAQPVTDCPTLGAWPYWSPAGGGRKFFGPDGGYQIVSAGKDGQFGPGGQLDANEPATRDNLVSFQEEPLGSK